MLKLDVSKFKKIHSDDHSTTLRHDDGHEMRIAHAPLSPKVLEQLKVIPMADGGEAQPKPDSTPTPIADPDKAKAAQDSMRKAFSFDKGGEIKQSNPKLEESKKQPPKPCYDEGGDVEESPTSQALQVADDRMKMQMHPNMQGPRLDLSTQTPAEGQVASNALGMASAGSMSANPGQLSKSLPLTQGAQAAQKALSEAEASGANMQTIQKLMQALHRELAKIAPPVMAEGGEVKKLAEGDGPIEVPVDLNPSPAQQVAIDLNPAPVSASSPQDIDYNNIPNPNALLPPAARAASVQPWAAPQQPDEATQQAAAQMPSMEAPAPSRQPASEAPPSAQPQSNGPDLMGGYNQQMQGIEAEAKAKGALGNLEADLHKQQAEKSQEALNNYNNSYQDLMKEREDHIKDVMNNRVDPDKYWDNHSKLAAGIGIILAGFNPKGGPNAALNFVNSQIDRSVNAQAQNLNSAHNLLAANMHQFGNIKDATAMTRVMMNDITANKLDSEIAKAQDPLAKARAMQLKGQLQQQSFGMMQGLALNQAMIKAGQAQSGQQGEGASPTAQVEQMLPYLRALKPEMAKELEGRLIPGVGMATVPVPQSARDNILAKQTLDVRARDLYNWAKQHSGVIADPSIQAQGATKAAELQSLYRNAINGGVFKKGEQEFIDTIIDSDPNKFFNKIRVLPKLQEVISSNQSQLNTLKQGYGLPKANQAAGLSPQQQSFVQWAQKNPKDPRSAAILEKLGVK